MKLKAVAVRQPENHEKADNRECNERNGKEPVLSFMKRQRTLPLTD
jgi:hypothetical protein